MVHGLQTLWVQGLRLYRGRDMTEMAGAMVGMIRELVTDVENEFVRLRGGAVAIGDGAVILPTGPETYMPAMVALLLQGGARHLGDEVIKVDPILRRVHPIQLPLLVDVEDLHLLPSIPPTRRSPTARARRRRGVRRPVRPDGLGSFVSEPTPLRWIVFPELREGSETSLEPVGGAQAVFRLSECCTNLDVWEERGVLFLRDLIESTAVSRLVVGSIPDAAELLLRSVPAYV